MAFPNNRFLPSLKCLDGGNVGDDHRSRNNHPGIYTPPACAAAQLNISPPAGPRLRYRVRGEAPRSGNRNRLNGGTI